MKRPAVFALVVAVLLGIGFGVGYWSRGLQPPEAKTVPQPGGAANPEPPGPSHELRVTVEPDRVAVLPLGPEVYAFRCGGGPVMLRLRVYADFEDGGVKKRAVYRAEDFPPPLPDQTHAA